MDRKIFDDLEKTFTREGPARAIDQLCTVLQRNKDYAGLFYGLLLKKRHELGVSPIPTGASQDLPEAVHEPYEEAIRQAGRLVGRLHLEENDIPRAWVYFRMLGEPQPVADALDKYEPAEGQDIQQLIEIAYHEGVHPRKGFDWILDRYGLCNAITTASSQHVNLPPDVRVYCIQRLVRALHRELVERVGAEIARREGEAPTTSSVPALLAGRDWLFADEFYHVDVSHLGAVAQLSVHLSPGEELRLARELCAYGRHLSPRFQYAGDPPFEDQYRDYGIYLAIVDGDEREAGLAHFRAKAEQADPDEIGTRPAEVLVNLLLRLDRPGEALAVARRYLAKADARQLSCPGIPELCQRAGDFRTLTEVAREQADPVHFLAGLLAGAPTTQPGRA
jgi:hypothetical protein